MALRILHTVEFYPPSSGGAQEVVRQLSERLAARGHSVTVATTRHPERRERRLAGVDVVEFGVAGNAVRGLRGDVEGFQRFLERSEFDIVMAYAAQQWTVDAMLPVLDRVRGAKILAPCGFSGLHDAAYAGYFDGLRSQLRAFDALVFHSSTYQDFAFARAAELPNLVVIPNGADEREFGELPPRGRFRAAHGLGDAPLLLTVGGHTGLKGHAEAMAALRRSRRAGGGALAIVGNVPVGSHGCLPLCRARRALTRLVRPRRRVLLVDPPRAEVLAAYADADVFVLCSAVECSPLVLFEAMAAGLPFVSSDVGNAREIAERSGAGVVVASERDGGLTHVDPGAVAAAVDELLADPQRRDAMGRSGRETWAREFTWEHAADRYEALYERLAAA